MRILFMIMIKNNKEGVVVNEQSFNDFTQKKR